MESPDNAHLSPFGPVIPTSSVPSWEGATNPNQGAKDPDPGIALLGLLPTLEVWFVAFLVFFCWELLCRKITKIVHTLSIGTK